MSDIALEFNVNPIANQNMVATLDSGDINISNTLGYCVQASWTGVPVGNIIVRGSLDGVTYKDLVTQAAGGAAGLLFNNVDGAHYPIIRVVYTFTSGTGSLNVLVSAKKYV